MRCTRFDVWLWAVVAVTLIGGAIALPMASTAAPPLQSTPTPRPTVGLPTFSSPVEGTPIAARIELGLAVNKEKVRPGDTLLYKAQVANVAGQTATNVWLTCDLPEGVDVQEVTATQGEVYRYGRRVSVELGKLQPAFDSQFVTIKVRVRSDVKPGSELIHHASLTSDQAGGGEREVKTVVTSPEATPTKVTASTLPTTGKGALPLWLIAVLGGVIVAAALFSVREKSS